MGCAAVRQAREMPWCQEIAYLPLPRPPSPRELQTRKDNLNRADSGVVHPDLRGIRTRRDNGQSGADFADFTLDARNSTHQLMSSPTAAG
ncbi:hypothetical protein MVI01_10210 [Myxococcus virescens]|uniref:Uncharacterized protein n=2 Tax=Myxococcus virescens TaxID=83456 RepID=A0A511H6U4_9BACT|nr:hypothetical protein MVI01_10210 [Myxococcus virescens]SDE34589.1 hypothetical protein SAMN04488504_10690 [Myxococcus virescens]